MVPLRVQRVKQHRVHGRVASFSRLFFCRRLLLIVFVFFFLLLFRATVDVPGEHVPEFLLLLRLRALFSSHCYGSILVVFVVLCVFESFAFSFLQVVVVLVVLYRRGTKIGAGKICGVVGVNCLKFVSLQRQIK